MQAQICQATPSNCRNISVKETGTPAQGNLCANPLLRYAVTIQSSVETTSSQVLRAGRVPFVGVSLSMDAVHRLNGGGLSSWMA